MTEKYFLRLLSISPALAAFSSYCVNLLAALALKSAVDYSHYLSLQSWAMYFGSISALCLVEMKQSPNGHCYSSFRLFGLATMASLVGVIGMVVASAATDLIELLVIGVVGFFYASLRNLMMVALMIGIPSVPVGLRLTRAGLLLGLAGLLSTGILGYSKPLHFMGVQAVAAAIAVSLYVRRIPFSAFRRISATLGKLWRLDGGRWGRRNLSYLVDMVHMPLFYIAVSLVAMKPEYTKIVYLVGLFLPLAAVLSEMIGERFRLHLGLAGVDSLRQLFSPYVRIGRSALFVIFLLYASSLLLACAAIGDVVTKQIALAACLFVQLSLASVSSLFGLVISRAGLEKLDLCVNLVVFALLLGFLQCKALGAAVALCASITLSTKYLAQFLIAYFELVKKPDGGTRCVDLSVRS